MRIHLTPEFLDALVSEGMPNLPGRAKCKGMTLDYMFFPDRESGNSQYDAERSKAFCRGTHPQYPGECPVLKECGLYALGKKERFGVWGGMSERNRHAIYAAEEASRPHRPILWGAEARAYREQQWTT